MFFIFLVIKTLVTLIIHYKQLMSNPFQTYINIIFNSCISNLLHRNFFVTSEIAVIYLLLPTFSLNMKTFTAYVQETSITVSNSAFFLALLFEQNVGRQTKNISKSSMCKSCLKNEEIVHFIALKAYNMKLQNLLAFDQRSSVCLFMTEIYV